ncbi:MAG: ligase-associated DNA damage response exonuclease [Gemmatimonadaceae bacterium]|jgi:putative mRNA 3-end processing factor|nr:ligase-associated DNA damage response exonuclease [Gemmatimonadaceae bacterium]
MLRVTDRGLYCEAGDFHVDPWRPVPRAVVTHAHGDHLAWGCDAYLVAEPGRAVAQERLGQYASRVEGIAYGEVRTINGVRVSLHPAGHILGSAQVRLEHGGEVWVVSGDYKTAPDPTCAPWEPVRCDLFVTESTFGLPIYRWPDEARVVRDINAWWARNAAEGVTSLLFGYALGKAQRLIAGLDPAIGPILLHGAVVRMTELYREAGIALPPTAHATAMRESRRDAVRGAIVVAPPSAENTTWARRFGTTSSAFASGWMLVRGARRRRGVARGFALSDHVDWPSLLSAIEATGASRVWVTHGFTGAVVRWLGERGVDARAIPTRWEGERDDAAVMEESARQDAAVIDEDARHDEAVIDEAARDDAAVIEERDT